MPLFHIGGMQFVLMAVKFGIPHLMMRSFEPATMLDAIGNAELNISNIGGVPAMWSAMSLMPNINEVDFSRIGVAATGAESVPAPMLEEWQQRGILLQEVYGMTETSGVVCMAQKADLPKHMGYAGRARPYGDVKVIKSDNEGGRARGVRRDLDTRRFGNAVYWNRPDATEEAFSGDWLKSGDIGRRDETGRLSVEDRIKDMYISGGENVYPAEIESTLMAHSDIREVAIIGVAVDPKWERWAALSLLISGEAMELPTVHALCEQSRAV